MKTKSTRLTTPTETSDLPSIELPSAGTNGDSPDPLGEFAGLLIEQGTPPPSDLLINAVPDLRPPFPNTEHFTVWNGPTMRTYLLKLDRQQWVIDVHNEPLKSLLRTRN